MAESHFEGQDERRVSPGALVLFVVVYSLIGYFVLPSFVSSYAALGPWWLTIPLAGAAVLVMVNTPLHGRLTPMVDGILGAILIITLAGLWIAVNFKATLKGIAYAVGWAILAHYGIAILIALVALVRRKEISV